MMTRQGSVALFVRMRGFIEKNCFHKKCDPAKSKTWIPAFAGMTIFSAFP